MCYTNGESPYFIRPNYICTTVSFPNTLHHDKMMRRILLLFFTRPDLYNFIFRFCLYMCHFPARHKLFVQNQILHFILWHLWADKSCHYCKYAVLMLNLMSQQLFYCFYSAKRPINYEKENHLYAYVGSNGFQLYCTGSTACFCR